MKGKTRLVRSLIVLMFLIIAGGCASPYGPPGPYYDVQRNTPQGGDYGPLYLSARDQTFSLNVSDNTPFGLRYFPQTVDMLYNKGYDMVRREREADFSIDISLTGAYRENGQVRAGNALGGAMVGAATGALIGAATGDPGVGAAIGAAGGGVLGLAAPASTPMVRIDIQVQSFTDRSITRRSAMVDLSSVPPPDAQRVIDNEVSRMLSSLPRR
ncbi:MAG: glycine zipper family protein [Syntrophobacteraceae bacterium]